MFGHSIGGAARVHYPSGQVARTMGTLRSYTMTANRLAVRLRRADPVPSGVTTGNLERGKTTTMGLQVHPVGGDRYTAPMDTHTTLPQILRSGRGKSTLGVRRAVQRALSTTLLLTLMAGMAVQSVAAQDAPAGEPAGTLVPGMITVQGIVALDDSRDAGSFDYLIDVTASAAVAEGYRLAGAGEQAFIAVDSATNRTIGAGSTDADGIAVLTGEVGARFYIQEIDDPNVPFGTNDIFLPFDDPNPAVAVTAIEYVNGGPASVAPSVEPTVEPSSEPLPSGAVTGTILPGAITVQGLVVEDPDRVGQTDYLLNVTAAARVGDFRPAREGEQTYQVVDLTSNQVIDSGTTDANGEVILDGEVDAAYYVVEIGDTGAVPGTDSLFYPAGDPNAYISLTAVRYVAVLDPAPESPSPSPATSTSPSPAVSDSPSAPAGLGSPSPVASNPASSIDPSPSGAAGEPPMVSDTGTVSPIPATSDAFGTGDSVDVVAAGDGMAGPSAATSRPAAPVISERANIGTLPNTGSGSGQDPSSMTGLALLLVAMTALAGAGLALRRRNA